MASGWDSAKQKINSIGESISNAGNTVTAFGNRISGVGSSISKVTVALTGVLAASFTKAKSFIGTYESAMTVFNKKLGGGTEAANKLYESLVKVAKGSAYAQEDLISAGQTLVAMGNDANTTTSYVQAATDAIAAMGGSGKEVEELSILFGKAAQQTTTQTRRSS